MKNPIEDTYNFIINKWGSSEYKGRGSIHCVKPLDYTVLVCKIITLMRNKNPTLKIFIAVKEWELRVKLFDKFKVEGINTEGISCVTEGYLKPSYTYSYDICFIIGINEITSGVYNLFVHNE